MRLHFDLICLAFAGVGAHAEPSALPVGRLEGHTKRHLGVHEPANSNEEERARVQIPEWFARLESKRAREEIDVLESQLNAKHLKISPVKEASTSGQSKLSEFLKKEQKLQKTIVTDNWKKDVEDIINREAPLLKSLTDIYGSKRVSTIISLAENDKTTPFIGRILKRLKIKRDPDVILAAMEMKENDALFQSLKMPDWVEYVKFYNRKYPNEAKSMRKRLIKYSDEELVNMLFGESMQPRRRKAVHQLLDMLIESWLRGGYDPRDVFGLLGLHGLRKGITFDFYNARFAELLQYILRFNAKWETKESCFSVFASIYGEDESVKMLLAAPKSPRIKLLAPDFINGLKAKGKDVKALRDLIASIKDSEILEHP